MSVQCIRVLVGECIYTQTQTRDVIAVLQKTPEKVHEPYSPFTSSALLIRGATIHRNIATLPQLCIRFMLRYGRLQLIPYDTMQTVEITWKIPSSSQIRSLAPCQVVNIQ